MVYRYNLTYRDYKYSQVLYRRHRWKGALTYYVWVWILPVLGGLAALPLVLSLAGIGPAWLSSMSASSAVGLWVAAALPLSRLYTLRKCWKNILPEGLRRSVETELPVELELTEQQLISALPGRSEGRFFWSALLDYVEDEKMGLIFVKKKLYLFIPREALPEVAWAELRGRMSARTVAL